MGKYMRKAKVTGEVAVMEVAGAPLGVRTRARTLALQRLQKPSPPSAGEAAAPEEAAAEYLELRSRRLEKPPPPRRGSLEKEVAVRRCGGKKAAAAEEREAEVEVSFGENVLELEALERSTRETTPCSLIRDSEAISTPGSTTRPSHSTSSHRRVQTSIRRNIPTSLEMEEFFAAAEQLQQQTFMEKYNFDPANECPLPGRCAATRQRRTPSH